jgi:ferredoxin-NADP reductase/ferredoxin
MRLGEPDMPNLLVAHHRPGFYFRVITEGHVQAGDAIVRTRHGRHELSVADVDALLYLPDRNVEQLRKAVPVEALSPGWQQSFSELLAAHERSTAATTPPIGVEPGWNGFRRLRVAATHAESSTVMSIRLETDGGTPLPPALPGQYLTVRTPDAGDPPPLRSYSLSGDVTAGEYRISVKREDRGQVSRWLHTHIKPGALLDAAAPRGDFYLTDDASPVVLLSAGIGATPVLAMLHTLAAEHSDREIWWLHTTHDASTHAFADEVDRLIDTLPHGRHHVFYSTAGRLDRHAMAALDLPRNAAVYMCGPDRFMRDMRDALTTVGIDPARIHTELFGALPPINPGIVAAGPTSPHLPDGPLGTGPPISFARSGITANWSDSYGSILEFAEACDVPTRFSCRSGVCHTCVTRIISGTTTYIQAPLEQPSQGTTLICVAAPGEDLVLDL